MQRSLIADRLRGIIGVLRNPTYKLLHHQDGKRGQLNSCEAVVNDIIEIVNEIISFKITLTLWVDGHNFFNILKGPSNREFGGFEGPFTGIFLEDT